MSYKIALYAGQNLVLSNEVACIVSFNSFFKDHRRRSQVFVSSKIKYRRAYYNFKISQGIWQALFRETFKNFKKFREEIIRTALWGFNYRDLKLYKKTIKYDLHSFRFFREISTVIKTYYNYYSIACAILTAMFFPRIGLPKALPKLFEEIYGYDFLDEFFFPPAFAFTILESTTDLLLGETLRDELTIAKSFLSFLLWKRAPFFLKPPYSKLVKVGAKTDILWITL